MLYYFCPSIVERANDNVQIERSTRFTIVPDNKTRLHVEIFQYRRGTLDLVNTTAGSRRHFVPNRKRRVYYARGRPLGFWTRNNTLRICSLPFTDFLPLTFIYYTGPDTTVRQIDFIPIPVTPCKTTKQFRINGQRKNNLKSVTH